MSGATWRRGTVVVPLGLAGVAAIGLLLRLYAGHDLWLDEATSAAQARLPFDQLLFSLRYYDVHPPLHYLLLGLVERTLGSSELALRLPSLLAGVLTIPMTYLLGRDLYGRRTALAGAALVAVSPFLVWYSQEARMYSLLALLSVTAVWAQVRATRDGQARYFALFAFAAAGMVWTHYFALIQVVIQVGAFGVVILVRHRRGQGTRMLALGWLAATAAIVLLVAPLAPVVLDQLGGYSRDAAGPLRIPVGAGGGAVQGEGPIYIGIANAVWAGLGYHSDYVMAQLGAMWPLLMLLPIFLLGRGLPRRSMLLIVIVAGSAVALLLLAVSNPALIEIRYLAGVVPLVMLGVARLVTKTTATRAATAIALIAAVMCIGVMDQQLNGRNPRSYAFKEVLGSIAPGTGARDLVLYAPAYLEPVLSYYSPDAKARPLTAATPARRNRRLIIFGASSFDRDVTAGVTYSNAVRRLERRRWDVERQIHEGHVDAWVLR